MNKLNVVALQIYFFLSPIHRRQFLRLSRVIFVQRKLKVFAIAFQNTPAHLSIKSFFTTLTSYSALAQLSSSLPPDTEGMLDT